jgi:hypothetical protein
MLLGVLPLQRMVLVGQRLVMTQAHQPMFSTLFADATSGTATTVFTSNAKLLVQA